MRISRLRDIAREEDVRLDPPEVLKVGVLVAVRSEPVEERHVEPEVVGEVGGRPSARLMVHRRVADRALESREDPDGAYNSPRYAREMHAEIVTEIYLGARLLSDSRDHTHVGVGESGKKRSVSLSLIHI